jgi:serine/threonine-protein phosphatase 6 regulatory ankyrin repeat subunit A/serine/threonine-protein phosphatase 6 regulatory ankyrin repeat subunit B
VVAPILFADPRVQNVRGQTALHRAVTKGEMALCETLISAVRKYFPTEVKKFVNSADKNGDTALHYASLEENREIGEFLLRNGATRELRNKGGKEFWQL